MLCKFALLVQLGNSFNMSSNARGMSVVALYRRGWPTVCDDGVKTLLTLCLPVKMTNKHVLVSLERNIRFEQKKLWQTRFSKLRKIA